jgi:hypothetical protein
MVVLCHFFQRGTCKNGDSCRFPHQQDESTQNRVLSMASQSSWRVQPQPISLRPKDDGQLQRHTSEAQSDPRAIIPCKYLTRPGGCQNSSCPFFHGVEKTHDRVSHPISNGSPSSPAPSDTRGTIPCKFVASPGGCRNSNCPFLHTTDDRKIEMQTDQNTAEETEVKFCRSHVSERRY